MEQRLSGGPSDEAIRSAGNAGEASGVVRTVKSLVPPYLAALTLLLSLPGSIQAARPRAPVISTTSVDADFRRAEARLALFISHLQQGRRRAAADLFSARVSRRERNEFKSGRWPRPGGKGLHAGRVLFNPDLRIRTVSVSRDSGLMEVSPREMKKREAGFVRIRMRRERGRWMVDLHPDK